MDPVEEERQARRAEERAQRYALLQTVPPTPVHVPQNLDDAILDLHRCQLAQQILLEEQQQRTTQDYRAEIIGVKAERQKQVEKRQLEQQRVADELEVLQVTRRVEPASIVQINQIMEEWRNKDVDALDYEGQQNRDDNRDLHVDRNMQEDILRIVSNIFH